MSENTEHNAGESNVHHETRPIVTEPGINRGRRALARAVLVGTPVILTLASRPSLAADINNACTVSGQLSGNMSAAAGGGPCTNPSYRGWSPSYWKQHPEAWTSCSGRLGELFPPIGVTKLNASKVIGVGTQFHETWLFAGTLFSCIFDGKPSSYTFMNVLKGEDEAGRPINDRYQLGFHTVGALLNALSLGKAEYGYSAREVIDLFNEYAYTQYAEDLKRAFENLIRV